MAKLTETWWEASSYYYNEYIHEVYRAFSYWCLANYRIKFILLYILLPIPLCNLWDGNAVDLIIW